MRFSGNMLQKRKKDRKPEKENPVPRETGGKAGIGTVKPIDILRARA